MLVAKVGYARVSTKSQKLDLQIKELSKAGCVKIFEEKKSAASDRPEFQKCLEYLREGDTLVVWKLDRLGRSTKNLLDLLENLKSRGISLYIITDSINTSDAYGTMFFTLVSMFAEMERNLTIERTKAGLEAARSRGRVGGRKAIPQDTLDKAFMLYDSGYTVTDVCNTLPIEPSTFYKYNKIRRNSEEERTETD